MKAILVEKHDNGDVEPRLTELENEQLPDGDVLVSVEYSTLNYKDGLVLTGQGNLVREYPHVPGIDLAGSVIESDDERYQPGEKVVLTGWHVGERHWGGYSQRMRVKADWLVPLPEGLTTRDAMAIGTAGFTAGLACHRLEKNGLDRDAGTVLVTGATGGVGSIACALLSARGYTVAGSTGRDEAEDYLRSLGVEEIVPRDSLSESNGKPLQKERWAACIDAVGGSTLATVLSEMQYGGTVAAIGLAGGASLETTVIPFLLRGVTLTGIDSVLCPVEERHEVWQMLAQDLPLEKLADMSRIVSLEEVLSLGPDILAGKVRGRTVVDLND